jgi:hypothetical protein
MQRSCYLIIFLFLFIIGSTKSSEPADSSFKIQKPKKCKTGWKPDGFPVLGYNTDIGFQYGAGADLFYYGDSCYSYPKYLQSFYLEASFTTKGGAIFQFFYDSDKLLKGLRTTADISYLTEKALDFYGFNGYKAVYHHSWEDDKDTSDYRTRMFYRHERKLFKAYFAVQGKLFVSNLRWLAGFSFLNVTVDSVNVSNLNKGQKESTQLPQVPGLYNQYVEWGILSPQERNGGMNNFIKLGIIYDRRDQEANPMKGLWSEVTFILAPKFLGDGKFGFIKMAAIHRQYFTLVRHKLSFAYRLAFQGTIAGKVPFYLQPIMINSWEKTTTIDGLGGSRNIRGILRNRVVGDGVAYANAELRWKCYYFTLFKQPCFLVVNAYSDAGMVVQNIPVDRSGIPSGIDQSAYFSCSSEYPHVTLGAGLRAVYNENFVVSADFGIPIDKRDGPYGIYIGSGFLF